MHRIVVPITSMPVRVCVHRVGEVDKNGRIWPQMEPREFEPVLLDNIMVDQADNVIMINGILANVRHYEIIVPEKVMKITFMDGSSEKVVLKPGDTFDVATGIRIAIAKHVGRQYYNLAGLENLAERLSYLKCIDKMISRIMREYEQNQKQLEKLAENQRAIEEAKVRRAEKAARKREARKTRMCECSNSCKDTRHYDGPRDSEEARRLAVRPKITKTPHVKKTRGDR